MASDLRPSIVTVGQRGWPVRLASKQVAVNGTALTLHVVEPLRDVLKSLAEYSTYLVLLVPAVLIRNSLLAKCGELSFLPVSLEGADS